MKSRTLLYISIACFALAVLVLAGLVGLVLRGVYLPMMSTVNELAAEGARGVGGKTPSGAGTQSYQSNGQRIYFTGVDEAGERIAFTGGPPWLRMHGGTCMDCHAPDGRGGPVMMTKEVASNIRYGVLTGKGPGAPKGGDVFHSDALIKRAITKGLDPDGGALTLTMPRWQMPDKDAADVIAYLKELGKEK